MYIMRDLTSLMNDASKQGIKIYRRRLVEERSELNADVTNAMKDKFSLQNDIGWNFEKNMPSIGKFPLFDVECDTRKYKKLTADELVKLLNELVYGIKVVNHKCVLHVIP